MILGFDAKRAFYNSTGLGNYSRNLLLALLQHFPKYEYHLYSPSKPRLDPFQEFSNVFVELPKRYYSRQFSAIWRSVYLGQRLERDGVELFHGLSNELPQKIHHTSIKRVVTIHDLIPVKFPELYPLIDRNIYKIKFKYSCDHADHIIAISEQTKADLIEIFRVPEEKISVVYQDCHPRYQEEVKDARLSEVRQKYNLPINYILYVGAISPRKNVLNIIKALHRLHEYKDLDLVIVGKGSSYKKELQAYAQSHNLQKRVRFLENVPDEDLSALYRQTLAFVYPSIYEGFGIPIIEALYSKVPVITSNRGCFTEAAGPGAFYIDPADVEGLAEAIKEIISTPSVRNKLITEGYEYVQRFNPQNFAKDTMAVYKKVMELG